MRFKRYMQSVFLAIAISVTLISGRVSAQSAPAPADLASVVLKDSEIDSSKVEVGTYAEITYYKGEKLETVRGYIKAVDSETLTVGRGLWKEQIAFEHIQTLIAKVDVAQYTGKTSRVGRETIFYSFESLFGYLGGYAGGFAGIIPGGIITRDLSGAVEGFRIGSMLGVASGVYWFDLKKRSKSFVGALSGSVVAGSLYLIGTRDKGISEKEFLWIVPVQVLGSIVGEWGGRKLGSIRSKNKRNDRKSGISIGPLFIPEDTGSIWGIAFNF